MDKAVQRMGVLPPPLFMRSDTDNSHFEFLDIKHTKTKNSKILLKYYIK
jgi:hypothetical protein